MLAIAPSEPHHGLLLYAPFSIDFSKIWILIEVFPTCYANFRAKDRRRDFAGSLFLCNQQLWNDKITLYVAGVKLEICSWSYQQLWTRLFFFPLQIKLSSPKPLSIAITSLTGECFDLGENLDADHRSHTSLDFSSAQQRHQISPLLCNRSRPSSPPVTPTVAVSACYARFRCLLRSPHLHHRLRPLLPTVRTVFLKKDVIF